MSSGDPVTDWVACLVKIDLIKAVLRGSPILAAASIEVTFVTTPLLA